MLEGLVLLDTLLLLLYALLLLRHTPGGTRTRMFLLFLLLCRLHLLLYTRLKEAPATQTRR